MSCFAITTDTAESRQYWHRIVKESHHMIHHPRSRFLRSVFLWPLRRDIFYTQQLPLLVLVWALEALVMFLVCDAEYTHDFERG
jgi:hypothetical protein